MAYKVPTLKPKHQLTKADQDKQRPTADKRGYTHAWRKLRDRWLADHPWCEMCKSAGKLTPATLVHHIVPVNTDPTRVLDTTNLMSLDAECHAKAHANDGYHAVWPTKTKV